MPTAKVLYNGQQYDVPIDRGDIGNTDAIMAKTKTFAAQRIQESRLDEQPSSDLVGSWKKWLTDEPEGTPPPLSWKNVIPRTARAVGRAVLPGSVPEAATDVALAAAGPAAGAVGAGAEALGARPAVAGLARAATRMGLPAAASAASGGTAADGFMAAGVGELMGAPSLVGAMGRKFGHLDVDNFLLRVRNAVGPEFAESIAKDINNPAMSRMIRTPEDVAKLVTPKYAKPLKDQFNTLEADISRVIRNKGLPHEKIPVSIQAAEAVGYKPEGSLQRQTDIVHTSNAPAPRPPLVDAQGRNVNPTIANPTHYNVSVEEAIKMAKDLRDMGRGSGGRMGQQQWDTYKLGEDITQTLMHRVDQLDPVLAHNYEALRQSWKKFVNIRDAVEDNVAKGILPDVAKLRSESSTKGGVSVDLPKFWTMIRQNLNKLNPEEFRNLHEFFTGVAGTVSGPERTPTPLLSSLRVYSRNPGQIAAGETIPRFNRIRNLPPQMERAIQRQPTSNVVRAGAGMTAARATSDD